MSVPPVIRGTRAQVMCTGREAGKMAQEVDRLVAIGWRIAEQVTWEGADDTLWLWRLHRHPCGIPYMDCRRRYSEDIRQR